EVIVRSNLNQCAAEVHLLTIILITTILITDKIVKTGGPPVSAREIATAKKMWRSSTEEPIERQVYLLLQHVSGELVHELSTLLKKEGITPEQYQVLNILNEAGNAGIPLSLIAEHSPAGEPEETL